MTGQRTATQDTEWLNRRRAVSQRNVLNIGKNNGRMKSAAATHRSTQFSLQKHSIISDPMGPKSKVIPSHQYNPQPKAPSRRDRRRAQVASRKH